MFILKENTEFENSKEVIASEVESITGINDPYAFTPSKGESLDMIEHMNDNVQIKEEEEEKLQDTVDKVTGGIIANEACYMTDSARALFLGSNECKRLVESGKLSKKNVQRIGRFNIESVNRDIACIEAAIAKKSKLAQALSVVRLQEKAIMNEIRKEFGDEADKLLVKSKTDYNRIMSK